MEDPIERTFEYSGVFESDYQDGCKLHGISPFILSRIGKQKDISRVASSVKFPVIKKYDSKTLSQADLTSQKSNEYLFTRKINVFVDDDDETFGIQIRGWKIPLQMIEVLVNSVAVSATISQLCLWNCNLTDSHANILLQLSISNIREFYLDQNPDISEIFFSGLIGEDSNIRVLSIRSNNIGDTGAKAIAGALKVNHSLAVLNLWDNKIRRDGAEALADALKSNQILISLSLAKNYVDDASILAFTAALSNQILTLEEVQVRRKVIAEWEKRREQEDKQKKGVSPVAPVKNVGKPGQKQEDPKKPVPASAKGKKVETLKPPKSPEKKLSQEDKNKGRDAKKPSLNQKGRKASIAEESEGSPYLQEPQPYAEPIYEIDGQWYTLGNRTLNNLDLSMNEITDVGLNYLYDVICAQESTNEIASSADGLYGVYRLSLVMNKIDESNPTYIALNTLLNKRNPFYDVSEGCEAVSDNQGEASNNGSPDDRA